MDGLEPTQKCQSLL